MALSVGLTARAAKVISEIQALTKEQQATGTAGMQVLLQNIMEHIQINGVIGTNVAVVSVAGVTPGPAASGPGVGTGTGTIT